MKLPLRFFCPADKIDWECLVQTERELQLIKDIASRLGLAIRVDESISKVFLGRSKGPADTFNLKDRVKILAQNTATSCGLTSCAMAVNTITGQKLDDSQFKLRHGMDLLGGLNSETPKFVWKDRDRPRPELWPEVAQAGQNGCPSIAFLNGPDFSPSGNGHVVCIIGLTPTDVIFADPNRGRLRQLPKAAFEHAQEYPQGNALYIAYPK